MLPTEAREAVTALFASARRWADVRGGEVVVVLEDAGGEVEVVRVWEVDWGRVEVEEDGWAVELVSDAVDGSIL